VKRILVMVVSLGLLVVSLGTAEAAKPTRTERTVQGSYGPYPAPVTGCNSPLGPFACLIVHTRPTERFFTAEVTDTHGQPVYVEVSHTGRAPVSFCGKTTRPIEIEPGSSLEFDIGLNRWGITPDCPAHRIKTTGTIRVTLSNLR
jgi:hypothetical protein